MTFDLKAAREICIKLGLKYPAQSLIDQEYQCSLAAEMLPTALDEIEQQNAYIEQLSKQCQAFIHDEEIHGWIRDHHYFEKIRSCQLLDTAKKWHAAYRKAQNSNLVRKRLCEQKDEYISEQAKRIAELEARRQLTAEHPDLFGTSEHFPGATKMVLTEEQRAALGLVCDLADEYECKYASTADEQSKAIDTVRALLQEARL